MLAALKAFWIAGKTIAATILAPPFCEGCYRAVAREQSLCQLCVAKLQLVAPFTLKVTARYHVPVLALSTYTPPLQKLILAKNGGNSLASRQLADLIWQYTNFKQQAGDYLVPIPLHWTRRLKRGFNQAELLAQRLATLGQQRSSVADILRRVQATKFQAELKPAQRWQNLQQAFQLQYLSAAERAQFHGRDLVLVDDLMTTGATLTAAAKALLPLRPRSIAAVVAGRVLPS